MVKRYSGSRFALSRTETGLIYADPKSRQLLERASRVAKTDATVLLLGESGTGKEVLASFIHRQSLRASGPFVALNCAAIPSTLLEATLFGYERGAYTGANRAQPGKFEIAASGTIFLDEIGELALDLQAKLLRILQERKVERVGSNESKSLDVRVIAATNQDLGKRTAAGMFREDLYYRINVFPIQISPLRERLGDILPLAEHFLLKYRGQMGQPEARLSPRSLSALCEQSWPGNARELENAIQRGLLLCNGRLIEPEDMSLDDHPPKQVFKAVDAGVSDHPNQPSVSFPVADQEGSPSYDGNREPLNFRQFRPTDNAGKTPSPGETPSVPGDVRALERQHILSVLSRVKGRRKLAVEILGISERTLRYKLKQWREEGFEVP